LIDVGLLDMYHFSGFVLPLHPKMFRLGPPSRHGKFLFQKLILLAAGQEESLRMR
jgi:hypothetical protein